MPDYIAFAVVFLPVFVLLFSWLITLAGSERPPKWLQYIIPYPIKKQIERISFGERYFQVLILVSVVVFITVVVITAFN